MFPARGALRSQSPPSPCRTPEQETTPHSIPKTASLFRRSSRSTAPSDRVRSTAHREICEGPATSAADLHLRQIPALRRALATRVACPAPAVLRGLRPAARQNGRTWEDQKQRAL